MLIELRIRNVAVIDTVVLPLTPGLNVLSGETGAGKSLIVGALSFLLGERAAADRVRQGADRASVEGVFEVAEHAELRALLADRGIEADDDHVVLKREVTAAGRSRAWVNGTTVTAALLGEVGSRLVNVHGQHDSRQLLDAETQRELLDRYAGASAQATAVAHAFQQLSALRTRERELEQRRRDAEQQADYLGYVVAEVDNAMLREGEDERLDSEIRRLSHAEELQAGALQAAQMLGGDEGSVVGMLKTVRRALASLARIDPDTERFAASLEDAVVSLDELSRELDAYGESLEANPGELRELEARRDLIHTLLRKHGPTMHDALRTADQAREQLALVAGHSGELTEVTGARVVAERELSQAAAALSRSRAGAARTLASEVSALLPELGMPSGRFSVVLTPVDPVTTYGAEQVAFMASLDAGGEPRALDRIASGGELSRLMLALSTVLARLQQVPTLVFDEIDAGIGGAVAWQVGALMQRVAAHHQVLAISHLAQIAAHAHHHIAVQKGAVGGVTTADTAVLADESRMLEIARMLGGDADREVSRAHARELLVRGAGRPTGDDGIPAAERGVRAGRVSQRRGKPV